MTKRKTVKTLELLSINGLCHIVGVPQSTVANWIEDFNVYIPEKRQSNVTYYHPSAIEVLKFIKKCKNQKHQKQQIMEMLANKNFPIAPIEDLEPILDQENYRENILTVMQTIGKTVESVSNQKESIKSLLEQQSEQNKRIKNAEKQTKEINDLKQEIKALKQNRTPAKEYVMKKESFAKLFD